MFDLYLLDDDWALNNANWQWLSCSNFFYQYFRCYSPIAFGKKTDKDGVYIKKWLPQLANFPEKYIYEPWKAPLAVQQRANCIIGKDYPMPIVDHDIVSKENMEKMKHAYANQGNILDGWVDGRRMCKTQVAAAGPVTITGKKRASDEESEDEEDTNIIAVASNKKRKV